MPPNRSLCLVMLIFILFLISLNLKQDGATMFSCQSLAVQFEAGLQGANFILLILAGGLHSSHCCLLLGC